MFAQDISRKVQNDFQSTEEAELALAVLADFVDEFAGYYRRPPGDRLLRCIVYVAKGDLASLDKAINLATIDYRDMIVWAEYDDDLQRVRDFNLPFE